MTKQKILAIVAASVTAVATATVFTVLGVKCYNSKKAANTMNFNVSAEVNAGLNADENAIRGAVGLDAEEAPEATEDSAIEETPAEEEAPAEE